jgi:hypothetical protein
MVGLNMGQKEPIFEEKVLDDFITNTYLRSIDRERSERWLFLVLGFCFILMSIFFILRGSGQIGAISIAVILAALALLMIINSEAGHFMIRRSAHPIRIYSDGIEVFASPKQKRKGSDGFIEKDKIDSIWIRRERDGNEEWFARYPIMRLGFAEKELMTRGFTELMLSLKNGEVYHSGAKPIDTLDNLLEVLRDRWGMNIIKANNTKIET